MSRISSWVFNRKSFLKALKVLIQRGQPSPMRILKGSERRMLPSGTWSVCSKDIPEGAPRSFEVVQANCGGQRTICSNPSSLEDIPKDPVDLDVGTGVGL